MASRSRNSQPIERQELVGPPALLIRLALGQPGELRFEAFTFEAEQRLRRWLRDPAAFRQLLAAIACLLDDDADDALDEAA